MNLWSSLSGIITVEITTASAPCLLTEINDCGIQLFDISYIDDLHIQGKIYQHDMQIIQAWLNSRGESIKVLNRSGLFWKIHSLRKRPILVMIMIVFLIMAIYLPTRVFFVQVEGNRDVPAQLILETAENCGVRFGASRRKVRSERMKNVLLEAIPELQWAGINTLGCVAVISVKERSVVDSVQERVNFSSIIASRDGVISDITVLQGNALCTVGQAVKKGQVLVSGYTDCGLIIKQTASHAEVKAKTSRIIRTLSPTECMHRGEISGKETKYMLRIGKNIINFCKDSGISDTTCVKMYEEEELVLPGGFRLPVALIKVSCFFYDVYRKNEENSDQYTWLNTASDTYLQAQLQGGQILHSQKTPQLQDGYFSLNCKYACEELIGIVRNEEIFNYNGKRD